jgi:hypothetical protein
VKKRTRINNKHNIQAAAAMKLLSQEFDILLEVPTACAS